MLIISPIAICDYFLPGIWLTSLQQSTILPFAGTNLYCTVTKQMHVCVCEQLIYGRCTTVKQPWTKPVSLRSLVQCYNCTTNPQWNSDLLNTSSPLYEELDVPFWATWHLLMLLTAQATHDHDQWHSQEFWSGGGLGLFTLHFSPSLFPSSSASLSIFSSLSHATISPLTKLVWFPLGKDMLQQCLDASPQALATSLITIPESYKSLLTSRHRPASRWVQQNKRTLVVSFWAHVDDLCQLRH